MKLATRSLIVAAVVLAPTTAQERTPGLTYRDFSLAQLMRVACCHKHFGRVDDLVVEIPSGRITTVVVTMFLDKGTRTVAVPFDSLKYEPRTNLLELGPCANPDQQYPTFDAAGLSLTNRTRGEASAPELEGTMLVSRLARCVVALRGAAKGLAQGLTLELSSGHVAFVDIAAGRERVGDMELHPVPWSALRLVADVAPDGATPVLALSRTKESLTAAPNLVEVIVQDPLYRAKVYAFFEVPRPVFDTEV